jgi:plexin A
MQPEGGGCRPVLALLVLAWAAVRVCAAGDIVRTFSDEGTEKFNHMVVDKNTGRVFIGAVNRLYQLSPELDQVMSEITGPFEDSPDCSVLDCPPNVLKKPTDNVNKALVIDYTTTRLISCGSLFQVRFLRFYLKIYASRL